MPNVWPVTIPAMSLCEIINDEPPELAIHQEMDAGPGKSRFNTKAGAGVFEFSQILTTAEVNILEAFYVDTLQGAGTFDETHPRLGTSKTFQFKERPTWKNIGGPLWRSKCVLKVLP